MAKKDFLTIEEAATELGIDRSTVYLKLKVIGMKPTKFPGNRKVYISRQVVEQIKALQQEPWKVTQKEDPKEAA